MELPPQKCPVNPLKESDLEPTSINRYLDLFNQRSHQVEDFLCCLPDRMRKDHMVAHSSVAAQDATPENPRVLMFNLLGDSKKKVIFSANSGHAGMRQPNSVEMAFVDPVTGEVSLYDLAFDKTGAKLSEANPKACTDCHGKPPRLIFDGPVLWPRFVNGMKVRSTVKPFVENREQRKLLEKMEATAKKAFAENPRFKCLSPLMADAETTQIVIDSEIDRLNSLRVAPLIAKTTDYERMKYAIFAIGSCTSHLASGLDCQLSRRSPETPCKDWIAPEMLRTMRSEFLLSKEIKEAPTLSKITEAGLKISDQSFESFLDEARSRNSGKVLEGLNFHFLPSALPTERVTFLRTLAGSFKSPLLWKYIVDTGLHGNGDPISRFLFESRGIPTNTWGTDLIGGYQRGGISSRQLLELEPPNSELRRIMQNFRKTRSLADINEICEELRRLSLAATAAAPPSSRPTTTQ